MSKVAIVYWSGTGNTQIMAESVKAGAEAAGAEVQMFAASEFNDALAAGFDAIGFGCPSMGAEQLEESEFEPMFADVEGSLNGKNVALFGSYGWGDGQWMRDWHDRAAGDGVVFAADDVICNEAPDDEAKANCEALGRALA